MKRSQNIEEEGVGDPIFRPRASSLSRNLKVVDIMLNYATKVTQCGNFYTSTEPKLILVFINNEASLFLYTVSFGIRIIYRWSQIAPQYP